MRRLKPNDPTSELRTFPVAVYKYDTPVDLKELSKKVAAQSALGSGEVYNALKYFCSELHEYLLGGRLVNIEGLGCFFLSLQGQGATDAESFATSDITGLRICFRASNDIRIHNGATTRTDGLSFIDVDKVNAGTTASTDDTAGGDTDSGTEEDPFG